MFILDTNVVSELRKAAAGKADANVVRWAEQQNPVDLYLSVVTVLELEMGILQVQARDPRQASVLRQWLSGQVLPSFQGRILNVDAQVAITCARLHVPDRRAERDALIAATAIVHSMTIVTRNTSDFADVSTLTVFNPW